MKKNYKFNSIDFSLTLQGFYHGDRCAYHVTRACDNLLLLDNQDPDFVLN